jgi:hypothetical protein
MNVKEIEDHKFDDLKLKLEKEIENLDKYVKPAALAIEELEKVEPLDEEKIGGFMAEIKLLEFEIKEREDKIDLIDKEVKLRAEVRSMIDNALKDLDFEEEETHKKWDRESKEEIEYKVPIVNQFLISFKFFDHIELKEELRVDGVLQLDDEGLPIEIVKEVKHIPWSKEAVLKELKLKLDLDKANLLVRNVKDYKHNKKKGELEKRLKPLIGNNVVFDEVYGIQYYWEKEEKYKVSHHMEINKWDKDDLVDFEEKVKLFEATKLKLDEKDKKEKPIEDRKREYHKIDDLLFEALVEKHEEDRPEKMIEYLKLRKEIKDKHPLED